MKVTATFITSGAGAADFPGDELPEVAFVGRSNVGKSSLINALVRQKIARTSAAPGKTRLVNIYRVARGGGQPFYFVDLPGFGYARGDRSQFEVLTRAFFGQERQASALLLVDSRHPGLESDLEAWRWLRLNTEACGIVATKIDKLSRAERQRAIRQLEAVLEHPVLPVSAATGEGLDETWILIDRLANNPSRPSREAGRSLPRRPPRPTVQRRQKR